MGSREGFPYRAGACIIPLGGRDTVCKFQPDGKYLADVKVGIHAFMVFRQEFNRVGFWGLLLLRF